MMNSTNYSHFVKNNEIGTNTKQDFNGQIQASDYDQLYLTLSNLNRAPVGTIDMANNSAKALMNRTKQAKVAKLSLVSPTVNTKNPAGKQSRSPKGTKKQSPRRL